MDVSAADVAKIPAENLRVPRAEFVALWQAAERCQEEQPADWYSAGVAVTCRWLANAVVWPDIGPWYIADSPATERTITAEPETIEAEYTAAVKLAMRRPRPTWLLSRPGWIEAIEATLRWAWHRYGRPPLEMERSATA